MTTTAPDAATSPQTSDEYSIPDPGPTDAELSEIFQPAFDHIATGAADRDANRELPTEAIRLLRERGFGRLRVPKDLGGYGATLRQTFSLLTDLAVADSNITQALRVHFYSVEAAVLGAHSEDETVAAGARDTLRKVSSGVLFGNAISEKGHGAVDRYQTTLTPDPENEGSYLLNGTKYYSTGSLFSDVISVSADLDGERVAVNVPVDDPGVQQIDDWDGFGQRLTGSGSTVFSEVKVSADQVAPGGYGTEGRQPDTSFLQLFHLVALAGIARRAADDVRDRVASRERTYTHAPADLPREDPLVQAALGRVYSAAFTARATALAVADRVDEAFGGTDEQVDDAELAASEAQVSLIPLVLDAVNEIFETGGASIVSDKLNLDRHWRNARTLAVHNPAIYKQQAIGRYALDGDGTALPYAWSAGVRDGNV
ncbi:MAG TPA: acyl-CoA dehydrogenase [Candidatus Corynebacterium avicola]|uniref:Acyl-CoA dehydrogenase n=1 Tax=Candidatus Corynebacterium avicola TaxID=2838527 RepID=A0A9D1ULB3_9CORY|nr:acyl-CoA dehydrogenase [Candidatus Corynebacterium avicola]